MPLAITRWRSCYLRRKQAATSFRRIMSSTRMVRTGAPQGSKLSPAVFNYYIADMPRPTPPVKMVCHGIRTQDPRTRPMKEALYYRHHTTVLPRLGTSKKKSLQNLYIHAVDSAIQLQFSPSPISDVEQYRPWSLAPNDTAYKRWSCERNLIILPVNINGIKNKLEELKLLIHKTHTDHHHRFIVRFPIGLDIPIFTTGYPS